MATQCPSLAFVLDKLRCALGAGTANPAITDAIDWTYCLELVAREGLAAPVYCGIQADPAGVPTDVISSLRASYKGSLLRFDTYLGPELQRTIAVLQDANCDPVILKGAALAYSAYPAPTMRSMGDVDLLFPVPQSRLAWEALSDSGFLVDHDPGDTHHHLPALRAPGGQLRVEIHHHLLPASSPYSMDECEVLSRCMEVRIGDKVTSILSSTDALHLACVHMAFCHRYRWASLRTLADVLVLASNQLNVVNWDLLLDCSRRWQTSGALYWPLRMARDLLNAPIPGDVLLRLAPPRSVEKLFSSIMKTSFLLNLDRPEGFIYSLLYERVLGLSLFVGCSWHIRAGAVVRVLSRSLSIRGRAF